MLVCTHAVLIVLYACVLYFCVHLFGAVEHVSCGKVL